MTTHSKLAGPLRRALSAALLAGCLATALAQTANPAMPLTGGTATATAPAAAADSAPAFDSFQKWLGGLPAGASDAVPKTPALPTEAAPLAAKGGMAAVRFEPLPVILGAPDLPLLGSGVRQVGTTWAGGLNYQGMHASYVLLDAKGRQTGLLPLSKPLPAGQRFRIRITPTFDGVAGIDQVLGTVWDAQRTGPVYPTPGLSAEVKAGQATTLPVGPNLHFVMRGRPATERLVLQVRHAKATADTRSDQPAYRQDSGAGSSYLQLVPRGQYPLVEQVLTMRR